jgi:hypothetical protein
LGHKIRPQNVVKPNILWREKKVAFSQHGASIYVPPGEYLCVQGPYTMSVKLCSTSKPWGSLFQYDIVSLYNNYYIFNASTTGINTVCHRCYTAAAKSLTL